MTVVTPREEDPVADLVGAAEIAERLGVKYRETVHSWRRRDPSFPKPVAQLQAGLVWDWKDVRKWAVKTGRL